MRLNVCGHLQRNELYCFNFYNSGCKTKNIIWWKYNNVQSHQIIQTASALFCSPLFWRYKQNIYNNSRNLNHVSTSSVSFNIYLQFLKGLCTIICKRNEMKLDRCEKVDYPDILPALKHACPSIQSRLAPGGLSGKRPPGPSCSSPRKIFIYFTFFICTEILCKSLLKL